VDALALRDVRLDYPGRPGVLQAIDLRLAPGTIAVVRGRSGSGKSSLLAIAAGLQVPTSGEVAVMGQGLDPRDPVQRANVRAQHVGLVLQHLHLLGELTLAENVALPLRLRKRPRAEAAQRSGELLARFGLQAHAARKPAQVSGGEQQRAAIARALALRPGLLLVDEPTSALDLANARSVVEALRVASAEGAAVLVASHDDVLNRLGHGYVLAEGRLERVA
jgi:ABC-type lipoprotein export system ATPase subunit